MYRIVKYAALVVGIILLQMVVLNNIQFSGYVNPFVYIYLLLIIPVDTEDWVLLLIAFFIGLLMDIFSGTPGMHTSATVMAAFARPYILGIVAVRDGYEKGSVPSVAEYGLRWFLVYSLLMIVTHHLVLFYMEVFTFHGFFRTFLRVLISSLFTFVSVVLLEVYITGNIRGKR